MGRLSLAELNGLRAAVSSHRRRHWAIGAINELRALYNIESQSALALRTLKEVAIRS